MTKRVQLGAGIAAWAMIAATAGAQPAQAGPADSVASQDGAASASAETRASNDIIVTGSRTIRNGAAAPTPVTTLTAAALTQTAPSNIPDALNQLPQFQLSASQYHSVTFNATAGLQGNYLNLRGLGAQRVLVLLDGTRVPPTSSSNAVDSNTLPQLLIERVDVVTGGASAAYGSDAVSGVVNYVLNKRFTGLSGVAQGGISQRGDGRSYRFGLAAGTSFADGRGHIEASGERYRNEGIYTQTDRPYYDSLSLLVGNGGASPLTQVLSARFNDVTFGGLVRSGALTGFTFNPNGTVSRFNAGTPTTSSNISLNGEGAYQLPTVLVPRLTTNQAFARASFDFSDALGAFVQGSYGRSVTGYRSGFATRRAGTVAGITIFADNPYLTPSVLTGLAGAPSFTLSRLFGDLPANEQKSITRSYNLQGGLTGKIGGLSWDATFVHGDAQLKLSQLEQNNRNFFAAVDAVRVGGQIVCRVSQTNPNLVPGCVPINVLGAGNVTPEALAFIRQKSRSQISNKLDVAAINVRGDLFQLPAGPFAFAAGGEMRWQKLRQTTNADPAVAVDYTGIRGVPTGVLPFATTNVGSAAGTQRVREGYVELNAPLLKDSPLGRRLDLNGAFRYTDYKTSGAVKTWKVGAIYEPFAGLRLRGTMSRDIAAPSLYDLFAGSQAAIAAINDPHTNFTNQLITITSGNRNINPEKARTLVAGIVLQPSFVPRLTISVDGYRIRIKDAIGQPDVNTLLNECELANGAGPSCALIIRPQPFSNRTPANFPSQINVAPLNLSSLRTSGLDVEVNYTLPLADAVGVAGLLDLRAFVNYVDKYDTKANSLVPFIARAGRVQGAASLAGLPKLRGTFQQAYRNAGLLIQLTERATGHYDRATTETFDPAYLRAPNRWYTDLYVSQAIANDRFTLFAKVDNLFDVSPPFLAQTINPGFTYPTDKVTYDVLQRYFTVGVKVRL